MTAQGYGVFPDDVELAGHLFMVGYTKPVRAYHQLIDAIRDLHLALFNNLVAADGADGGPRGDEGHIIELTRRQGPVFHLDDVFFPHGGRVAI